MFVGKKMARDLKNGNRGYEYSQGKESFKTI